MSYYIETREQLPTAIRRIVEEQRDMAKAALQNHNNQHEGIHKARKHFKKLRALMRLVRDEIGEKAYKKQNVFYRDLGRSLSDLRDATSLLEALELLHEVYGDFVKNQAFKDVEAALQEEREHIQAQYETVNPVEDVITKLEESENYVDSLNITANSWDELLDSTKRVYKRGYNAFQKSVEKPTPKNIHEWRKRTKYLWYHYRLLKISWKPVLNEFAKETHELSNLLGDHRDLTLLKEKIEELEGQLTPKSAQVISALATQYQEKLTSEAYLLSTKLFADEPNAFKNRLRGILSAWRKERNQQTVDVNLAKPVAA